MAPSRVLVLALALALAAHSAAALQRSARLEFEKGVREHYARLRLLDAAGIALNSPALGEAHVERLLAAARALEGVHIRQVVRAEDVGGATEFEVRSRVCGASDEVGGA
jgi:GAF domain-containing protein